MRSRIGEIVRDRFNRADSAVALGSAETGQAWTANTGTWGISSNRAYSASDAEGDLATLDSGLVDGKFESIVNGSNDMVNYRVPRLVFRGNSDASEWLGVSLFGTTLYLTKLDGALIETLASLVVNPADATDYLLRAECSGNQVDVYQDGVLRIQHTLAGGDTKYAGAGYTRVGLRLSKGGTPTAAARWDNLRVAV